MTIDPEFITRHVLAEYQLDLGGVHGPAHWLRVRQNGLALARRPMDHYPSTAAARDARVQRDAWTRGFSWKVDARGAARWGREIPHIAP